MFRGDVFRNDYIMFLGTVFRNGDSSSSSGDLYVFTNEHVMKYDGDKNSWTAVASLPQYITHLRCATQWRDWIFVSGLDDVERISYLFNPSTGQWIEVKGDGGATFNPFTGQSIEVKGDGGATFEGVILLAATLQI